MVRQTNIKTCRVSELNKQNFNVLLKSKFLSKFVTKLLEYVILFKDIRTFLGPE